MRSFVTAPSRFILAAAAVAAVLVNVWFTTNFESSLSLAADISLLHLLASTQMIVNGTKSQSVESTSSLHEQATKVPPNHKNATIGRYDLRNHLQRPHKDESRKEGTSSLRAHPHAGARDTYGNWGYVADHQIVRKRLLAIYRKHSGKMDANYDDMIRFLPLDINETRLVCDVPPKKGIEMEAWDMVATKIKIGGPAPLPLDPTKHPREPPTGWETINFSDPIPPFDANVPPYRNKPTPPKIGCFLYTYKKRHAQVWAAAQTWGWRCDGFLAFSDQTDPDIGAVDLPHQGGESYGNMWQKVRSIWAYIHDNYIQDFDYFHLAGDDTYVIVENLRNYLWSINDLNGTKPLYIGSHHKTPTGQIVCGGGSGYIFNRVTLQRFVATKLPKLYVNAVRSYEDRLIGISVRSFVRCYETHDAHGAQRFWAFDPHILATFDLKKNDRFLRGVYKMHDDKPTIKFFFNRSFAKADLLSSQLITWHILRMPRQLKRMNAIMYRSCPKGTVLADALSKVDNN